MGARSHTAMVLAAGLGMRMRPLTLDRPKPLIEIGGRTMLDRALDALVQVGVERAVINTHWLGDQIRAHAKTRSDIEILICDESEKLLDSAGGIVNALPLLGDEPFFIINSDTFWFDDHECSLQTLANQWDETQMDLLLLLADPKRATGHSGTTDFLRSKSGDLSRANGGVEGYIYAGAGIINPQIFAHATSTPHSLNLYFDQAIANERLKGSILAGHWITVGTPDAIEPALQVMSRLKKADKDNKLQSERS